MAIEGRLDPAVPLVALLPSAPTDGQVVAYLADATNGIVWMLKYRASSASAYKWEFLGGSDLFAEVPTAESTASITYAAMATAGPAITLPLAGDYDVAHGANIWNNTVVRWMSMSYDIGGTGAVDADAVWNQQQANAPTFDNASRKQRKTGLTAVTLTAKYKVDGGTGLARDRWISARPVRVG